MSLIPLLLGRLSATAVPLPATTGQARYDPGSGHRPAAAAIAVGMPVALLVAVALSPFELPVITKIPGTTVVHIPAPLPPPPKPVPDPVEANRSVITAPTPIFKPVVPQTIDPVVPTDPIGPTTPDIGTRTDKPMVIESLPASPPLIAARIDSRFGSSFQPDYPPFEQRSEIEGTSRVRVLVGTDGRVKAVEDAGTTSPGFFTETKRRALAKWRFKPATRGGVAEESWTTMTVRFRLDE